MPHILDTNLPIQMGNCIHVTNYEKEINRGHEAEPDIFICIQVENETGKEEYPILLTQKEFDRLEKATFPDMDAMVPGRIYPKYLMNKNCYCVKLKQNQNDVFVGVFDIADWANYYQQAIRHPDSCTRKSIWTDMFD